MPRFGTFQKGDLVLCLDGNGRTVTDEVYTVTKEDGGLLYLAEFEREYNGGFYAGHFVLASSKQSQKKRAQDLLLEVHKLSLERSSFRDVVDLDRRINEYLQEVGMLQ